MTEVKKIVECVPNFSEGRDQEKIERIVAPLKEREGVRLVNYECDKDYNRLVVTVLGEPQAVKEAVLDAISVATELIDLNVHEGEHSRMGATDVVPFIPIPVSYTHLDVYKRQRRTIPQPRIRAACHPDEWSHDRAI